MKDVRREFLSLLTALSLPIAVFLVLPYSSLWFAPADAPDAPAPFAAFVGLTPEQEAQAMRRAKSGGQGESAGLAFRPADLILSALPDDAPPPIVRLSDRARPPAPARVGFRPTPYLPTCAAPAPAVIPAEGDAPPGGFTKEELLKLDD